MKNKSSILVILIVLNIIILFGLIIFIGFKWFDKSLNKIANQESISVDSYKQEEVSDKDNKQLIKLRPKLDCQDGWSEYYHDVIGISFCYPEEWGEPYTEPHENITKLDGVVKQYSDTINNSYSNSLYIRFKNREGFHNIKMKIFNDKFVEDIKGLPGRRWVERYNEFALTRDISNLVKHGDVCNYEIKDFDYTVNGVGGNAFKLINSGCEKNVRSILTENKQYFTFVDNDPRYTYDLRLVGFKKLSNSYFDYLLINNSFDRASQITERISLLNEFFTAKKTNKNTGDVFVKTKEQFDMDRAVFEKFVNSIVAYDPILKQSREFETVKDEDPNINAIRKYYWLIETGKLKDAYNMKVDNESDNFVEFDEKYKDAYVAEASNFKKIGDNQYDFQVKYQDHNSSVQKFHIQMSVNDDKLETIFVEEYLTEIIEFNGMKSFATRRGDKNYIVLHKDGKEFILNEGGADYESGHGLIEVKFFDNIKFSPKGSYITYRVRGWEWSYENIYDVSKNTSVTKTNDKIDLSSAQIGFTDDEKYFYFCSSAGMSSGPGGQVYSVPDFDLKFDVLKDDRVSSEFLNVNCNFDKINRLINFRLFSCDYGDDSCSDSSEDIKIKYNLVTEKVY